MNIWAKLDQDKIWESNDVKILGVTIDDNLRFDKHVSNICLKTLTGKMHPQKRLKRLQKI